MDHSRSARTIVIGGGPAGLMAAEVIARAGRRVAIFDQAASPARKFLLAGRGGLNLTHSDPPDHFLKRYGAAAHHLASAIEAFPPEALRDWCAALGEPTFVGTSGRIFPKSFKSSPLLRAWLRRLATLGVELRPRCRFLGFGEASNPILDGPQGRLDESADAIVLACGGASWPRLGSDGAWVEGLQRVGVETTPLQPANCGLEVGWSAPFKERFAGTPLKSIAMSFDGARVRGEAVVTATGLEGGAVYALSAPLREAINAHGEALLEIDLKPDIAIDALTRRLEQPRGAQSFATFLRKAVGLAPIAIALLREAGPPPSDAAALAQRIKHAGVRLTAVAPIARAISSAGGVAWSELDDNFMLRRLPGVFAAGEMLDWEAPTGGYLLQACFATGAAAGRGALKWLER
ncbi:TIGR03862 family flavoprotein [Methylocapsa sp. S129]|uniref:NAD(P)/FAD-dependent oxidoreductase n=1 Tax=Methylocapsa sp. S129 TaxID=1641869 RepID=UPI00131C96F9|nr:TIGR03862 family flavoprotein [Methylocapsa sp. S129]